MEEQAAREVVSGGVTLGSAAIISLLEKYAVKSEYGSADVGSQPPLIPVQMPDPSTLSVSSSSAKRD